MLRSLAIHDFAIIDHLEVEFGPGFTAITGETGAGKSILVDALALLLGDRADSSQVREGCRQAELHASFELPEAHPARDWLEAQALDDDDLVMLRRLIPADGSSRAWINGRPATISQLRELGTLLVEIFGQHEHQRLGHPAEQREWLDRQVDTNIRQAVAHAAARWSRANAELQQLAAEAGSEAERELLQFQLRELEAAAPQVGEFEQLEAEQRRLASVDTLKSAVAEALEALSGDRDQAADHLIHLALRAIERMRDEAAELGSAAELLETAAVHLDEATRTLQRFQDGLEHDPGRLAEVEQRLERLLGLARKHRVAPDELPAILASLDKRLEAIENFDARRTELEQARDQTHSEWAERARALSDARREAAERLAGKVQAALAELGMADARIAFEIEHDPAMRVSPHGADRIELMFSANPGVAPRPLAKVASGGELSRLSLAMIIAGGDDDGDRVRVFDEVDAGVGGETAHAVGRFLKRAGRHTQAFCVTHLAQVAAFADHQWRVSKHKADGQTRVTLEALTAQPRITEIARMLGGADSESARSHARDLLEMAKTQPAP